MPIVNMLEAKTQLSRLVDAVESGREPEIIIARNGKPAARLVPIEAPRRKIRLGLADGKYSFPEPGSEIDQELERMFDESEIFPPGSNRPGE